MTPRQIAADVDRLLIIKAQIAALIAEAKTIEARLETAGLQGEQIPLQDPEREGKQFLARGTSKIIPIRFESDSLITTFRPDSDLHKTIASILLDKLDVFFKDTRVFERKHKDDANKFRILARTELAPDTFASLIAACVAKNKDGIPKSKTVIAWDDAKPIDQSVLLAP
jgi:hypothetical protein